MKFIIALLYFVLILDAKEYKFTNSLKHEDSPYLLQHSHNPINWYMNH